MRFLAGPSAYDEEERAFLQRRIALFGKVAFLISVAADTVEMVGAGFQGQTAPVVLFDRAVTVTFLGMWLICARGARSVRFLRILEATTLAAVGIGISLMGRFLAVGLVPEVVAALDAADPAAPASLHTVDKYASMMIILGGSIMFALRAAVVPSPPGFTLLITGVIGLPYIAVPWFVAPATGDVLALRPGGPNADMLVSHTIWWTIITAGCTIVSAVVYGLRRDVREARKLGQYTLEKKLGEGGMGAVYRASHAMLRRPTALKLLPPDKMGEASLKRFEREVQLTATLTHPNTITIYDYGRTPRGVLYYAMELVDGPTLQDVVERHGPLPAARVAYILAHTAGALAEAHSAGLIHRDIKPANIMLCERGCVSDVVKVLDFGLVKDVTAAAGASLTNVDAIQGTPHYMSPEAIGSAQEVTAKSDVYALGAVGYFLLTGSTVYDGDSVVEVCSSHLHVDPIAPSERLDAPVPQTLEALILACLDKDPDRRPVCDAGLGARLLALEGVAAWTPAAARAWWQRHGEEARAEALASESRREPLAVLDTVAVKLAGRSGPRKS